MPVTVETRRFNVREYYRMGEAGILHPGERDELLDGEVILMSAIGSRHAGTVARLTRLLTRACEAEFVWTQNPVRLSEWSEPQPDVCILRPRDDDYTSAHPTPTDVLLLIEVSDTSLLLDRQVKLPIYAAAGIREYWIVDLEGGGIEVHLDPGPEGYGRLRRAARGDDITPGALPGNTIAVDDILP